MVYFRRYERTIVFGSQLIPSVRLIAPGIAGVLRVKPREFLMATTLGIALWNSLFIGVGYASNDSANISDNALKLVLVVLVAEVAAAAVCRSILVRRARIELNSCQSNPGIKPDASGSGIVTSVATNGRRHSSHKAVHGEARFRQLS